MRLVKVIVSVLILMLTFSLVGCNGSEQTSDNNKEVSQDVQEQELKPIPEEDKEVFMGMSDEEIIEMGFIPPKEQYFCVVDFHGFERLKEGSLVVYKNGEKINLIESTPGASYNLRIITPIEVNDKFKLVWADTQGTPSTKDTGYLISTWKVDKWHQIDYEGNVVSEYVWKDDNLSPYKEELDFVRGKIRGGNGTEHSFLVDKDYKLKKIVTKEQD